jgi:hypothetical protein
MRAGEQKMERLRQFLKAMRIEQREHRSSFIVFTVLRLSVILVMIRQIFNGNYESVFLCLLTLLLLVGPSIAQITLRVELPSTLEIIILLFVYAAEILGEIRQFYEVFPHWDTILHTLNGFLAAAIGFSLVELLNRNQKLVFQLSPFFTALVALCFSMTVGIVWEFFEFMIFGLDMQKDTVIHSISSVLLKESDGGIPYKIDEITEVYINGAELGIGGYLDIGLIDTMADLFVNFIGALVFAIFGYRYAKRRDAADPIQRFIPIQKDADKDYLLAVREKDAAAVSGLAVHVPKEEDRLQ